MATKTYTFTVSLTVRDMTDDEFAEAGGLDFATDEDDSSPEGFAENIGADELATILGDSLDPNNSDELFAGTDQFLVVVGAEVSPVED